MYMTSPHKDGEYFAWNIAANLLRDPNAPTDVAEFVVDGHGAELTILAGRTGLHTVVVFGRTMGSPEIEEICVTWMPTNTERKGGHISVFCQIHYTFTPRGRKIAYTKQFSYSTCYQTLFGTQASL